MMTETLRALIVDDEPPARQLLRELLVEIGGVDVIGECVNGFEAVRVAQELRPDLLLLDVQMPKLDGFEVMELLAQGEAGAPAVIFVTAHDAHAVRAFEVHAIDYLLKPVRAERLRDAIERVRARPARSLASPDARRLATASAHRPLERVAFRRGSEVTVIPVESVDFVEAQDDFVVFHAAGEKLRKQQTLQEVEALLDPARFVRIHRSLLLQLDRLARIESYAKDSRVAHLKDGRRLPVSRAGYERLRQLL